MNETKFPPLEDDLPREALMERATEVVTSQQARYPGATVDLHFKFTCEACGERCTLAEPNSLFEDGICCVCGNVTKIEYGGFTLVIKIG